MVYRDYLLGMEIVLPSGEVMKTGTITKKMLRHDLTRLICGRRNAGDSNEDHGSLLPKPKARPDLLAIYDDIDDAGKTVAKIG